MVCVKLCKTFYNWALLSAIQTFSWLDGFERVTSINCCFGSFCYHRVASHVSDGHPMGLFVQKAFGHADNIRPNDQRFDIQHRSHLLVLLGYQYQVEFSLEYFHSSIRHHHVALVFCASFYPSI